MDTAANLEFCDILMAEGQACSLPLMPGSYAPGPNHIEFTIAEFDDIVETILQGQKMLFQAILIKPDGTEVACLQVHLEMA